MATPPLAFSDFRDRCLRSCGERSPPEEAHCPICTEEYDRGEHEAMRIIVQPPAQCNHEFCRDCLNKIFSRRKIQDNANICPLCRAIWFQAEYESMSARSRRLVDEAANALRPHDFASRPCASPNHTVPNTTGRDSAPVPPPIHTPRPYTRTSRRPPPAAQPHRATRHTQSFYNWRTSPLYLYREVHAAIAAERAEAERTVPQAASSRPYHGPDPTYSFPGVFQFGQQGAPNAAPSQRSQESSGRPTNNGPAPGVFNYPPDERDTTRGSERSRAVPPLPAREAEIQRRATALDAREAQLTQRENRINRERQELQQRQQEFNALTEHARTFLRNRDANM